MLADFTVDVFLDPGDRHQNYAWDYADPASPTVGSEFVGTSITSGGDGADTTANAGAAASASCRT